MRPPPGTFEPCKNCKTHRKLVRPLIYFPNTPDPFPHLRTHIRFEHNIARRRSVYKASLGSQDTEVLALASCSLSISEYRRVRCYRGPPPSRPSLVSPSASEVLRVGPIHGTTFLRARVRFAVGIELASCDSYDGPATFLGLLYYAAPS